jgi:asparagine synthase (glutamine-hydrolysing)
MNINRYRIYRHSISSWFPPVDFEREQDTIPSLSLTEAMIKKNVGSSFATSCFLSGGVDSSLLAAILKPETAYVAVFEDDKYNEVKFARKVADDIGFNLKEVLITRNSYTSTMEYLIRRKQDGLHPNEPCLYLVAKQMKKDGHISVISGEGADDIFGGYSDLLLNEDKYMKDKKTLFNRYSYTKDPKLLKHFNYVPNMERFILEYHTPGLIQRAENACGCAGVKVNFPYLSGELPQLMWEAKPEFKREKSLLKQIAIKYLPDEIVYRQKVGFPIPVEEWFGGIENFLKFNVEIWKSL